MGTETTSASYRRTQNPRVTKRFYEITGIQKDWQWTFDTNLDKYSLYLFSAAAIHRKQLFLLNFAQKVALPPPPKKTFQTTNFFTSVIGSLLGEPVTYKNCFVTRGFWVRRYVALVVSVPIPLRTQRARVPTRRKAFLRNYWKQKKCQRTLDTNAITNFIDVLQTLCYTINRQKTERNLNNIESTRSTTWRY